MSEQHQSSPRSHAPEVRVEITDWARAEAQVMLNAQVQALDFYRRQGFIEEGEPFMEAGIVHRAMRRCCRASGEGGA